MKNKSGVFAVLALLLVFGPVIANAETTLDQKRSCFGLLWCTERSSDSVATDGLLYLYSSERKPGYSRLAVRPFYSEEKGSSEGRIRRSVLWPLGTYEKDENSFWFHLFPIVWKSVQPNERFTLVPPIYLYVARSQNEGRYIFPFYGKYTAGDEYQRSFFLGPAAIHTVDKNRDLHRWDVLYPLVQHQREGQSTSSRLAPLYFSASKPDRGESYRYLLPLYGAKSSPDRAGSFLFPLYGTERVSSTDERRFSALGLPPIPGIESFPALSLFAYERAPDTYSHRFFPLYNRTVAAAQGESTFGMLGAGPASIFWNKKENEGRRIHLFPLYGYRRFQKGTQISFLGLPPTDSDPTWALYEHMSSPEYISDRFFPLYAYSNDRASKQISWDALLLYQHRRTPLYLKDALLPLHSYVKDYGEGTRTLSFIGIPPATLFRSEKTKESTLDYLFPLYSHLEKPGLSHKEFSALGYRSVSILHMERSSDTNKSHLFPFYGKRNTGLEARTSAIGFPPIGNLPALALYEHQTDDQKTSDRFVPIYWYQRDGSTSFKNVLILYNRYRSPDIRTEALFPIYSRSVSADLRGISVLGIGEGALFRTESSSDGRRQWLMPLYSFKRSTDGMEWKRSYLGIEPLLPLSLVSQKNNRDERRDTAFPFYGHLRDKKTGLSKTTALGFGPSRRGSSFSFYEHAETSATVTDRFFPLYGYQRDIALDTERVDALLLYHHGRTGPVVKDRLFPLYSYSSNRSRGDAKFSLLWPLATYRKENHYVKDASLLWWLIHYEKPDAHNREFRLLGGKIMAVLRNKKTEDRVSFEFNPVVPFYSYEKITDGRSRWNLLGGLLGYENNGEKKRMKILWIPV